MPRAAKAATTEVRIAPFRMVVIDGYPVGAGEVVSVPAHDAVTLIADGYAVSPDDAVLDEPARVAQPTVFDGNGAPVEFDAAGRRPLTPEAIERGEEERGA
jgi:threonine dehydrogenase-like Zn-dependent dehydrogenase